MRKTWDLVGKDMRNTWERHEKKEVRNKMIVYEARPGIRGSI